MVERLAGEKSLAVAAGDGTIVLGADTTVVLEGRILGKPASEADASDMLLSISGRTHLVLTGWAIACDGIVIENGFETSLVSMRSVTQEEADTYRRDRRAARQGGCLRAPGRRGVPRGGDGASPGNVIGLPLKPIVAALRRASVEPSR